MTACRWRKRDAPPGSAIRGPAAGLGLDLDVEALAQLPEEDLELRFEFLVEHRLAHPFLQILVGRGLAFGLIDPVMEVNLPVKLPPALMLGVGVISIALIFIFPVRTIRSHYGYLELLESVEPGPKKSRASEAGKNYIEQARKDGRTFTRAEVEILETSREDSEPEVE